MRRPARVNRLLCFLLLSKLVAAQSTTPKPHDYSQEPLVIEKVTTSVRFEDDGTSVQESSGRLRIQSDSAVQQYSVLRTTYAGTTGDAKFDSLRVVKKDGTIVTTP